MDTDDKDKEDPKFSEVIGALVAGVASARNVADVEALRIARQYFRSDLLRGLPVPRLRISRIDISLPVILREVMSGRSAEPNGAHKVAADGSSALVGALRKQDSRAASDATKGGKKSPQSPAGGGASRPKYTDAQLATLGFVDLVEWMIEELTKNNGFTIRNYYVERRWESNLGAKINEEIEAIKHGSQRSILSDEELSSRIANVVKEQISSFIRDLVGDFYNKSFLPAVQRAFQERQPVDEGSAQSPERPSDELEDLEDAVLENETIKGLIAVCRDAAERAAVKTPSEQPDFRVTVHTEDIKHTGGGPENVTRLSFSLLEEGLEWLQQQGPDGRTNWKLSQE